MVQKNKKGTKTGLHAKCTPPGNPPTLESIPTHTSTFNGGLVGALLLRPCRHGLHNKIPGSIHVTSSRVGLMRVSCLRVGFGRPHRQ